VALEVPHRPLEEWLAAHREEALWDNVSQRAKSRPGAAHKEDGLQFRVRARGPFT